MAALTFFRLRFLLSEESSEARSLVIGFPRLTIVCDHTSFLCIFIRWLLGALLGLASIAAALPALIGPDRAIACSLAARAFCNGFALTRHNKLLKFVQLRAYSAGYKYAKPILMLSAPF